jgi:hypothetical protein
MANRNRRLALAGLAAAIAAGAYISLTAAAARGDTAPQGADPHWWRLARAAGPIAPLAAPTMRLNLTDGLLAGRAPLAAGLRITVSRQGRIVASLDAAPQPDESGWLYAVDLRSSLCPSPAACEPLASGDRVRVSQAGASTEAGIPAFTALADPQADLVYGGAPAGLEAIVYLLPFTAPETVITQSVTAGGAGTYHAAGLGDIAKRDSGWVALNLDAGRSLFRRFVAPLLRPQLGGRLVEGYVAPNAALSVAVASLNPRFQPVAFGGQADAAGAFHAFFPWRTSGDGAPIGPGTVVTVAAAGQVLTAAMPALTARLDRPAAAGATAGVVHGAAPPGASVEVYHFAGPITPPATSVLQADGVMLALPDLDRAPAAVVTATANGQYSATLLFAPADYGAAVVTLPGGQQAFARFAVPHVSARLGQAGRLGFGQIGDSLSPLTFTLRGASGWLKDERALTSWDNGVFLLDATGQGFPSPYNGLWASLEAGDAVTVASPTGLLSFTVPTLTAQAYTRTVAGLAAPGAQVRVTAASASLAATRIVTADPSGAYTAEFHDLDGDIAGGQAIVATPGGHTVSRSFTAPPACQPALLRAQAGGDLVEMRLSCMPGVLHLRAPGGDLKAEQRILNVPPSPQQAHLRDANGQPARIEAGDTLELREDAAPPPFPAPATIIMRVPTLTVRLSVESGATEVEGEAPPGATVSIVAWRDAAEFATALVTATASGQYQASLDGAFAFRAGDAARASIRTAGGTIVFADAALPLIRARLHGDQVEGRLQPLAIYTLTVAPHPSVTGTAWTDGSFSRLAPAGALRPGDQVEIASAGRTIRVALPALTARLDARSATVTGQAPPGSQLEITLAPYGIRSQAQAVAVGSRGAYTAAFPDLAPFAGGLGSLVCLAPDGQQAVLDFGAPGWQVTLGDPCVNGRAGLGGVAVTLTHRSAAGTLRSRATGLARADGGFALCLVDGVATGDRLELDQAAWAAAFVVPALTARHDAERGTVAGQAPPGSRVRLSGGADCAAGCESRQARADAAGRYVIDVSDARLWVGQLLRVSAWDEPGNQAGLAFTASGRPRYVPMVSD